MGVSKFRTDDMVSVVVPPAKMDLAISPSRPESLLSLPTIHTTASVPAASVALTAGEPWVPGPPHQAIEAVGGLAAAILKAASPPDWPLGQDLPVPLKTT